MDSLKTKRLLRIDYLLTIVPSGFLYLGVSNVRRWFPVLLTEFDLNSDGELANPKEYGCLGRPFLHQ